MKFSLFETAILNLNVKINIKIKSWFVFVILWTLYILINIFNASSYLFYCISIILVIELYVFKIS